MSYASRGKPETRWRNDGTADADSPRRGSDGDREGGVKVQRPRSRFHEFVCTPDERHRATLYYVLVTIAVAAVVPISAVATPRMSPQGMRVVIVQTNDRGLII